MPAEAAVPKTYTKIRLVTNTLLSNPPDNLRAVLVQYTSAICRRLYGIRMKSVYSP